ncbi:C40 family peptidase [Blastococcus sp. CT_GayMR16]|uniref:C40 family peptidase n=1 Tax=Blastococcus sp. CT_GayMR16 TaxID=2559607 RepID=UPI001FD760A0|nr:C40 family peptidase [Blastococcus sp. CT_GayMR16]
MQFTRTTTRRRSRAALALGAALVAAATGLLSPTSAGAAPATAAEASELVRKAAEQLTIVDEQIHEAELIVANQQQEAAAAAGQAAAAQAALAAYEPQLRAIAQSGYTGKTQSRFAAFLTSESATELVQQMTTLDMIAEHTNSVVAEVAAAQEAATLAQAAADQAAATATAGLEQLQGQRAEVQKQIADYQAAFGRLSAPEQTAVTTAVAGRSLQAPRDLPMPPGAAGEAIATALAQVGDRYEYGATGPDAFDCSGLTSYAYAAAGISLPHSSGAQSQLGTQVSRGELQAGDLVFFYTPISHVGLYIGNGMMVHARTYGSPVAVTSVDQRGFRFGVRLG